MKHSLAPSRTIRRATTRRAWRSHPVDPVWLLLTFPTTIVLTLIVLAVGRYTSGMALAEHREFLSRVGADVTNFDLRRVLAMPLATFTQSSPGVKWSMILLVTIPLVALEWLIGSLRAAVTFLLSDWLSAPLTLLGIWILAQLGSPAASRLLDDPDSGSSAAAHGTIAAVCMLLPGKLRIASLGALFTVDFAQFTFQQLDAALAHFLASIVGVLLGAVWLATTSLESDSR